jgi:hypothetical protein
VVTCRPGRRRSLLDRPASCRQALLVVVPRVGIDRRALADTRKALPAGAALYDEGRLLLKQADRLRERVKVAAGAATLTHRYARRQRRAGRGPLVTAFHRCHPHVEVSIHEADLGDPTAGLRAGLVDIALTRALHLPLLGERLFRLDASGLGPGTGRVRRCPPSRSRRYPAGAGRRGRDCRGRHREDGRQVWRQRPPRPPVRRAACPVVRARRPAVPVRLIVLFPQPMTERTPVRQAGKAVCRPRFRAPASVSCRASSGAHVKAA